MKYIIAGVVLAAIAACVTSEWCEHADNCTITQCVNGTRACKHEDCICNEISILGKACMSIADCKNGDPCKMPEHGPGGHEPHHHEPTVRKPGHDHEHERWHCIDSKCDCRNLAP